MEIISPMDLGVAILALFNIILAGSSKNVHSLLGWLLVALTYSARAIGK